VHLAPQPIAGVAIDLDPSASHLTADVPSRVAMDVNRADTHAVADAMDARHCPLEVDPLIGRIACGGEDLGKGQPLIPMLDFEFFNFRQGLVAYPIRDHPLDLDRNGSFRVVAQVQRHEFDSSNEMKKVIMVYVEDRDPP
jgi:hypothetical protein